MLLCLYLRCQFNDGLITSTDTGATSDVRRFAQFLLICTPARSSVMNSDRLRELDQTYVRAAWDFLHVMSCCGTSPWTKQAILTHTGAQYTTQYSGTWRFQGHTRWQTWTSWKSFFRQMTFSGWPCLSTSTGRRQLRLSWYEIFHNTGQKI